MMKSSGQRTTRLKFPFYLTQPQNMLIYISIRGNSPSVTVCGKWSTYWMNSEKRYFEIINAFTILLSVV